MIYRWILFFILVILSGCNSLKVSNINSYSGQSYGHTHKDYQATVIRNQLQFEIIEADPFFITTGPELVTDYISKPKTGALIGTSSLLRLGYRLSDFTFFGEFGAGPVYLSIPTREQGCPGFNFIDQVGGGLEYRMFDRLSLGIKYRYTHISHAGFRSSSNLGIDAHSGLLGAKCDF